MKENRLSIQIHRPVEEVFDFLLNPANTPRWIESFEIEETNEWPVRPGTIYRNKKKTGQWSEYVLSVLEPGKMFEMVMNDHNYHVRYTFTELGNGITEVEYYEWVERGDLEDPFTPDTLEKLKSVIEGR